jgi:hypothetical protein
MRYGRGRKGEHLKEVKTQERIGSAGRDNTRRMVVRILTWLNPLKARTVSGQCQEGQAGREVLLAA